MTVKGEAYSLSSRLDALLSGLAKDVSATQLGLVDGLELSKLREALNGQVTRPVSELIDLHQLSYASPERLTYPLDVGQAQTHSRGETTVLQGIERTSLFLAELVATLKVKLGCSNLTVAAYLTAPGAKSFQRHSDGWDNVLIQLYGEKCFTLDHGMSFTTPAGSIAFIRKGVPHRTSTTRSSVHLSLAFHA